MRNPAADQAGGTRATKTTPCCSKVGIKRGPWTAEEDEILARYIKREGEGAWRTLPKRAGLLRCGKSCRLRWMNYLRPHLNRGPITPDEEDLILRLHRLLGNRWSLIAGRIPGRTDNEIKNFWNTHLSKKLISQGLDPRNHKPLENYNPNPKHISSVSFCNNNSNNKDDNHRENYVRSSTLVEDSGLQATPNPNPNLDATSSTRSMPFPPEPFNQENDGMIMSGYNEEMYFSSFLDSLIVSDECVFPEPNHATNNNNNNDNDNSNNHMFQDQSMMMMMQPMGYEAKISHGFVWGSGHEVSPLMDLEFSGYQRDQANGNLDLADMHKQ